MAYYLWYHHFQGLKKNGSLSLKILGIPRGEQNFPPLFCDVMSMFVLGLGCLSEVSISSSYHDNHELILAQGCSLQSPDIDIQCTIRSDVTLEGSGWINGDRINVLDISYLFKWFVYWGYNTLILTSDPNFLGHPSSGTLLVNYHVK